MNHRKSLLPAVILAMSIGCRGDYEGEDSGPTTPTWPSRLALVIKVPEGVKVSANSRYRDGRLDCPVKFYDKGAFFVCDGIAPTGESFDFALNLTGSPEPYAPPACLTKISDQLWAFQQDAYLVPAIEIGTTVDQGLCYFRILSTAKPTGNTYCSVVGCSNIRLHLDILGVFYLSSFLTTDSISRIIGPTYGIPI